MFYDKRIKYLDYYESGSRIRGAGYVRLEARGQSLRMELAVTNLHPADTFEREVFLCAGKEEKSVGTIRISEGRGQYRGQWSDSASISGTGIAYTALEGIHIPLGAGREISCHWQEKQPSSSTSILPEKDEAPPQKKFRKVKEELLPPTEIPQKLGQKKEAPMQELQTVHEPSPAKPPEQAEIRTAASEPAQQGPAETRRESSVRTPAVPQKLLENKWEQLWALYPHLRPFQDKREYLSIKPADFVVFSASSYRMSNNSFLLHGYYNYKHLIVTRIEKKGEIRYYIGVPGNYFEKEKQVAIMFGFESFECAEEPAQAGDFGYYMMRIEI